MIVFPDSSSHVLDHATPVVPVELDGRLDRGLALEAKHKWPGFEAACQDGLAREQLCAETPRALAERLRPDRTHCAGGRRKA